MEECVLESEYTKYGAIQRISDNQKAFQNFLAFLPHNQQTTIFVYDLAASITFARLDCFIVDFSEVYTSAQRRHAVAFT